MAGIKRRLHFPASLGEAIAKYANALLRDDARTASGMVSEDALEGHRAAFERTRNLGPFEEFEVIARAKLGFQYIAKIRLYASEHELTLQCRWREENGAWRIAEIDDIGLRSPWLKPESEADRTA